MHTDDLRLDGTIGGEHLLHDPGGEVHAGLDEHRVNDLSRPGELRPAGCVIAHARAPQTFLVELVALLAGFLVALDFVKQVSHRVTQFALVDVVHDVGEVLLVESVVLFVFETNHGTPVFRVFYFVVFTDELKHFAFNFVVIFGGELVRHSELLIY